MMEKRRQQMNDADFRRVRHTVRFTSDEDAKMRTIMANNGYRSVSIFIRDLLFKKQIVSRREVVRVTDRQMRNQMNDITYQIKKMGENYNQIVARYNSQAKMFHPDGRPFLNTQAINAALEELKNITEDVRDEVAVAIELIKTYTSNDDEPLSNP